MLKLFKQDLFLLLFLVLAGMAVLNLFTRNLPGGLYFVDSARYADIAQNLTLSGQFKADFAFPRTDTFTKYDWFVNLPPMQIQMISLAFNIFGIGDQAVILTSMFFFLASLPLVFLLARKFFTVRVAIFSALFYLFSFPLLNFAKDGGADSLFIFELLLISYLLAFKNKWTLLTAGILSGLTLFTKLQSYIFIPIFIFWIFLLHRKDFSKVGPYLFGLGVVLLLHKLGILFGYYLLEIPTYLSFQQTSLFPADDLARSNKVTDISLTFFIGNIKVFLSKVFYNLYNFHKSIFSFDGLLPQFGSPLVVIAYLLSLTAFLQKEIREVKTFKMVVLLMFIGSLILAAATSPQIRYIHYVLPFIIILGVEFLEKNFQQSSSKMTNVVLSVVLSVFLLVPFFGKTVLDARFEQNVLNTEKQYGQQVLGKKLGSLTQEGSVVVTNLDSWGAWYGGRKTILIPINLEILSNLDKDVRVDAIYLTDFQKDNADHPIKGDWGQMFNLSDPISSDFINEKFKLAKEGVVLAEEVYENQSYRYKLWIRKD